MFYPKCKTSLAGKTSSKSLLRIFLRMMRKMVTINLQGLYRGCFTR